VRCGLGVCRGLSQRNIRLSGFAVPVWCMVPSLGVVRVRCIVGLVLVENSLWRLR